MEIGETLQRKIGPLPVWAWGGVAGGTLLVVKALTGGGGGASSPFVTPIATDIPFDFSSLPSGGGSGGGSVSPPASTPPTAPKPATSGPRWGSDVPKAITDRYSASAVAAYFKRRGLTYGTAINLTDLRAAFRERKIDYGTTINPVDIAALGIKPTGDTTYGSTGEGNTTPGTPIALVPFGQSVPLGNVLDLPAFDAPSRYAGVTIDALTPIASAARIVMPPVNGEPTGSVIVPKIPDPSARARRFDPRRLRDPLASVWRERRVPIRSHTPDLSGWGLTVRRDLQARFARDRSG